MPSTMGLQLSCRQGWLNEEIVVQGGREVLRWEAAGTFKEPPTADILLPIRHLRVLYALPPEIFEKCLKAEIAAPHEFYCSQDSLNSYNSQPFQRFLKRMSVRNQYRAV
jgi:hypothetical protein